ncbi:MAG: ABC transporter ATP-binding protein [Bacteroidales bacterium]|nr:ABC transporter ATP-binding protein [Bacteroidales bacterium]MCF8456089.1 ABC transporter ATP-binding protein [Bacteroidales bacterium]
MLLQLNNISKSYHNATGKVQRQILSGLNLSVEKGDAIAIVGSSGSGKTTILNLIGKLDQPDSGEIIFDGKNLDSMSKTETLQFRNQDIGFVFQQHFLLPQCSLWENVLIPVLPNKSKMTQAEKRGEELLRQLGIWDLRYQKPGELSIGECQRTALVRALINKPALLLADEPTGSLDEDNAGQLAGLLLELNKSENTSLIVVTHSMSIAKKMDKIFELKNGKLESFPT